MKRRGRMIALSLTVILALAFTQLAALAEVSERDTIEYLSSLNAFGVTYFNVTAEDVKSKALLAANASTEFLLKVANSKIPDRSNTLMAMWKDIARAAYYYKLQDCKFSNPVSPRHALQMYDRTQNPINSMQSIDTTPSYEQTLEGAYQQIKRDVLDIYEDNGGRRIVTDHPERAVSPSLDDTIDDIETNGCGAVYALYGNVVGKNHASIATRGRYGIAAVIMHNFRLIPLVPEGLATKEMTWDDNDVDGNPAIFKNETLELMDITSKLESETVETISNSRTTSSAFETEQSVNLTYTYGSDTSMHSLSVSAGLSFKQTFAQEYSQGESISKEVSNGSGVSLTLPAHTKTIANSSIRTEALRYSYDCPVAVAYDVLILRFDLNMTDAEAFGAGGDPTSGIIAGIGSANNPGMADAREDFVNRYYNGGSDGDGLKGKWSAVAGNAETLHIATIANSMKKYAPLSITGGVITNTAKTISYTVGKVQALYPLREIKPSVSAINLSEKNETLDLSSIQLTAYNEISPVPGEYYGFSADNGTWKLYTEDDPTLTSKTDYAEIVTDSRTGAATLVSLNVKGTAYLIYVIDETKYAEPSGGFTKNSQIKPAVVRVDVSAEPFTGSVSVSGAAQAPALTEIPLPRLSGQTVSGVTAVVSDASGNPIEGAPISSWISSNSNIAAVSGYTLKLKAQGSCTLTAKYKGVASGSGAAVTVQEAAKLARLEISPPGFCKSFTNGAGDTVYYYYVSKTGLENPNVSWRRFYNTGALRFSGTSEVKAYDQYGNAWTDTAWKDNLTWTVNDEPAPEGSWNSNSYPTYPLLYGKYYFVYLNPDKVMTLKATSGDATGSFIFTTRRPQTLDHTALSDPKGVLGKLILTNDGCSVNLGQLTMTGYDQYDMEISALNPVSTVWTVTPSDGVTIEEGNFATITNPGDYKVKATVTMEDDTEKTTPELSFTVQDGSNIIAGINVKNGATHHYYQGDTFDPAGLVIQYYYYQGSEHHSVAYGETTKNDFTFNPTLDTALTPEDKHVTIGYGGQSVKYDISVSALDVETVHIDPASVNLNAGDAKQLTASLLPVKATVKELTWASSDTSVAEVSADGLVTAKKHGNATITATATDGGGARGMCLVSVNGHAEDTMILSITPAVRQPMLGDTVEFEVTIQNNPGLASCNLTVAFDKDVFEVALDAQGKPLVNAGGAAGTSMALATTPQAGQVGFTMVSNVDTTANGTLLAFSLSVKEGAAYGSYPLILALDESNTKNAAGETIPYVPRNALVTLRGIVKGDVDMDTLVMLSDAQETLRYLSGLSNLSAKAKLAADVDNDNKVAMTDVLRIMRHVAKLEIIPWQIEATGRGQTSEGQPSSFSHDDYREEERYSRLWNAPDSQRARPWVSVQFLRSSRIIAPSPVLQGSAFSRRRKEFRRSGCARPSKGCSFKFIPIPNSNATSLEGFSALKVGLPMASQVASRPSRLESKIRGTTPRCLVRLT